jgi:2-dehydro-3-deoxyphosphogluconate aldolase/(4S)-4-hydroxy-2-oxoglutarate aldolase
MRINTIHEICKKNGVMPVLKLDDAQQTEGIGRALIEGGLTVLEVTLRSEYGLSAIKQLKQLHPEAIIGAGTVTNVDQFKACVDMGADFIVSPGSTSELLDFGAQSNMPFLPGVSTVSEIMTAMEFGFYKLKLFPASIVGGPSFLKSVFGPLPQLRFCPTGGVTSNNALDYLQLPNVMCVGGTWLTPPTLVEKHDWSGIKDLARYAAIHLNTMSSYES